MGSVDSINQLAQAVASAEHTDEEFKFGVGTVCPLWYFDSDLYSLRWVVGTDGEAHMRSWCCCSPYVSWIYFLLRVRCNWHESHVSANFTFMSGYQQTMQNIPTAHLDRNQENVHPHSGPGTDRFRSRAWSWQAHTHVCRNSKAYQMLVTTWGFFFFWWRNQEKQGLIFVINQLLGQPWVFLGFTKEVLLGPGTNRNSKSSRYWCYLKISWLLYLMET